MASERCCGVSASSAALAGAVSALTCSPPPRQATEHFAASESGSARIVGDGQLAVGTGPTWQVCRGQCCRDAGDGRAGRAGSGRWGSRPSSQRCRRSHCQVSAGGVVDCALVFEVGQDGRIGHRTGELVALQVAERSASVTAINTHSRVRSGSRDRLNAGPVKLQRAAVKMRRRETLAAGGSQPEMGLSSS